MIYPRLHAFGSQYFRWTWALIAVILSLVTTISREEDRSAPINSFLGSPFPWDYIDIAQFAERGNSVLGGDIGAAYRDSFNQTGPAQTVFAGVFSNFATGFWGGVFILEFLVMFSVLFFTGIITVFLLRNIDSSSIRNPRFFLYIPIASIFLVWIFNIHVLVTTSGHWWQIPVVIGWIFAGYLASKGRILFAGLLIGVTIWFEPWGIFGIICLWFAPAVGDKLKAVIVALSTGGLLWVPFLIQPDFSMGKYQWTVSSGTAWAMFVGEGSAFTWGLRFIQAFLIFLISFMVAWRVKNRLQPAWAAWLTACVIILIRIATDTFYVSYYWANVQVMLIPAILIVLVISWRSGLLPALALWLTLVGSFFISPHVIAFLAGIILILVFTAGKLCPQVVKKRRGFSISAS